MEKGSEKKRHSYGCLVHRNEKKEQSVWDEDRMRVAFREAMVGEFRAAPAVAPAVAPEPPRVIAWNQEELDRIFAINEP